MPIAQLGYRPWEGRRTGATRRWLAITRTEVAIAWQNSKLLRRFIVVAWLPILYFSPFFLAVGYVANPANELGSRGLLAGVANEFLAREGIELLRQNPQLLLPALWTIAFYAFFAYTQSLFAMIVVAIVGPPLIAKDQRSKAFLVYFSKPIRPWQYLLGKAATVALFVFALTLFPALLLYAVGVALSPDLGTTVHTFPIVLRVVAASLVVAIPVSLVALLVSSLTKNRRVATFAWLAVWIFGEIAFRVLTFSGNFGSQPPAWASLLSLRELTTRATSWAFDLQGNVTMLLQQFGAAGGRLERTLREIANEMGDPSLLGVSPRYQEFAAGSYPHGVSVAVLAGLSVLCVIVLLRRVTQPVRI